MDCELRIQKADNGYICRHTEEIEDGVFVERRSVFEEDDTEFAEMDTCGDMLYFVKDYFGITYNKHSKKNLVIKVVDNDEDSD